MAHSHHNHGDMDMGPGHGDMDMPMCSMNMLFTWDTSNLCIVFSSWRVTGTWSLVVSLLGVVVLTAGYEALREISRRYETSLEVKTSALPRDAAMDQAQRGKLVKAALYGAQVFYSFFIMLLFMTYNGWIMLAVGIGAFVGFLFFGSGSAAKTVACH